MDAEARLEAAREIHRLMVARCDPWEAASAIHHLGALAGLRTAEKKLARLLDPGDDGEPPQPRPFVDDSLDKFRPIAARLFPDDPFPEWDDVQEARDWVEQVGLPMGRRPRQQFLRDRLDREMRELSGIDVSRRIYNKRFRMLRKLERHLERLELSRRRRDARFMLGEQLTVQELANDIPSSACMLFEAAVLGTMYWEHGRQQDGVRLLDSMANSSWELLQDRPETDWMVVAHGRSIVASSLLTQDWQRLRYIDNCLLCLGRLGRDFERLLAGPMRKWQFFAPPSHEQELWNCLAKSWDVLRRTLLECLHDWGAEDAIATRFPVKMPRSINSTRARSKRHMELPHNQAEMRIWAELPWGFRALDGTEPCTPAVVAMCCRREGIDPYKYRWLPPPRAARRRPLRPTLEDVDRANLHVVYWADWALERALAE